MIYAITTHQSSPRRSSQTPQIQLINLYYFFQIVKELNSLIDLLKTKPESPSTIAAMTTDSGLVFPGGG